MFPYQGIVLFSLIFGIWIRSLFPFGTKVTGEAPGLGGAAVPPQACLLRLCKRGGCRQKAPTAATALQGKPWEYKRMHRPAWKQVVKL